MKRTARWSDLIELYRIEGESLLKLSRLNYVSVFPKPIERQSVKTCLRVFSEETVAALSTHPQIDHDAVSGTRIFIQLILNLWKIFNVRVFGEEKAFKDDLRAVFSCPDDPRFDFLQEISEIAHQMKPTSTPRKKCLTHDTSKFLIHNMSGFTNMTKYLLSEGDRYVLFGAYSTDNIEKDFGKHRQGTGGTYFLTVQSALEKISINKAKLCLKLKNDLRSLGTEEHQCDKCKEELNECEEELISCLELLECDLQEGSFAAIIYIAGFIQKKCKPLQDDDTTFYLHNYGKYLNEMDRGGLTKPFDSIVQWTCFCYIFFTQTNNITCRKNMMMKFNIISQRYNFHVTDSHSKTLCNIFMNNYAHLKTPKSTKEASLE